MKPPKHIIASISISAIFWFFTKSVYASLVCLASGILSDFDHVIEYIIHYGFKGLTLRRVYEVSEKTGKGNSESGFKKLYIVFHSGELAILAWILAACTKNIYIFAFAVGYSAHLVMDYIGNSMHFFSFFMFGRLMKKFSTEKIFKEP